MGARTVLTALILAGCAGWWGAAGVIPDAAASTPRPVSAASMADPGVLLNGGHFYAFSTGSGLRESIASIESGAGQARVMYAAVLTFGPDGYTPSVSFLAPTS